MYTKEFHPYLPEFEVIQLTPLEATELGTEGENGRKTKLTSSTSEPSWHESQEALGWRIWHTTSLTSSIMKVKLNE